MSRHMLAWFLRVLLVTWAFWGASALFAGGPDPAPLLSRISLWLGGAAPMVLAILALLRQGTRREREGFLSRVLDPRVLRPMDWVRVLLPAPLVTTAAIVLAMLVGSDEPGHALAPEHWLLTPLVLLVFGPLPEEIAWRGWALERLQRRDSALQASLVLAVVWMLWHLPLFFIEGTYQHGLGAGSPAFWLFMLALLPQSLVLTWVYNTTGGSILAAILMHWMINVTGELFSTPLATDVFVVLLWGLFAAGLVAVHGPDRLCHEAGGAVRRAFPNH